MKQECELFPIFVFPFFRRFQDGKESSSVDIMSFDRFLEAVIRGLVKVIYNPKVYFDDGTAGEPRIEGPAIIVCNHTSHLDGPIVNSMLKGPAIRTLAAKDRFEQKGFGFFLRHTGCIPIDRQNADTSWIHESMNVLGHKGVIAIYPEGRHGTHRCQLPFHSGVSMLAVMARVPIVMIYIDGPHKAFHRSGMIISKPFTIDVPDSGLSVDYIESQTKMLEERMRELMGKYPD